MDSVNNSSSTKASKSRLTRTISKVLHVRAAIGAVQGIHKAKSHKVNEDDVVKNPKSKPFEDEDEELRNREALDAFLAKLFASVSAIKAGYAQLQFAQSPYDPDGIQSADHLVVSELKYLSEMKQCFTKKQFDEDSPEKTQVLAEIKEQKSLIKTYEIMGKKLDSQVKLKDSEITFLKEKLADANGENKMLERRLNSSGQQSIPGNLHLSSLSPTHFISFLGQTIKSIRSFVKFLSKEMEIANWDLTAAATSIEPGVVFSKENDKFYAFESFVSRVMFDGFDAAFFAVASKLPSDSSTRRRLFFDRFMELKSMKPAEYLAWKPKSTFAKFCRSKYLRLVHSKMEASLFGNFDQRNLVKHGEYPETVFFSTYADMAKRVWLLHCLAFSFEPEASIFQVSKDSRFSDVYMESVTDDALFSSSDPRVAFTVVPGFRIGKTVIQCQVYLC